MDSEEEDYYYPDSGSDMEEEAADGGSDLEQEAANGSDNIEPNDSAAAAAHRRKRYKILKEEDIKHLQENDISEVSSVLSVPRGVACALLCRNNWCITTVYDEWFAAAAADGERNPDPATKPAARGSTTQMCKICYENTRPQDMFSAACGHPFCAVCWKTYIAVAISDGAGCLTLRCPEPGCGAAATSNMVENLSSGADFKKYHQHLRRSYVESNRSMRWCPATGCGRAVQLDSFSSKSYDVVCDCSHSFCWGCGEERHRPVDCKTVVEWLEKNRSEAENTTWILAYTKPCPKCKRPIEKNQGCNHMRCGAPCKFDFCWMCGGAWDNHGGQYYNCNKYEKKNEDEASREMARRYMVRYMHYFERWASNDKSRKAAMNDLEQIRSKNIGEGDVVRLDFVVKAWEQIVECRRVLKWSYVYGYYLSLSEAEGGKRALFEYLQGEAEAALEKLHHCVEKEMIDEGVYVDRDKLMEFRVKLLGLTTVNCNFFENLVVALENDLAEVIER